MFEESLFDENILYESTYHQLREQTQRSKPIKSWLTGKIHKLVDVNDCVYLSYSKNNFVKYNSIKKKVRKMRMLNLHKSADMADGKVRQKVVINTRDLNALHKFKQFVQRQCQGCQAMVEEVEQFIRMHRGCNYKLTLREKKELHNSFCNYSPAPGPGANLHTLDGSFESGMSYSESGPAQFDQCQFDSCPDYTCSDIQNENVYNNTTQTNDETININAPSEPQEVRNAHHVYCMFKSFIELHEHKNNIAIADDEQLIINQIKQIIGKQNGSYEFDELVMLFNLILEDSNELLIKLFKHIHTHTIMIQLIDCVVKKRYALVDGLQSVSLCKCEHVDYINDFQEKENHMSMVINSTVFNNKFMHPRAGFQTEFRLNAHHDAVYEMTFQDTSLSQHRHQPLGQFQDPDLKILQLTIKKQQHDKFQIEQMQDDQQMIVYKMSSEINYNNVDRLTNYYVLGFNIEKNTFESVNLEVAMFREESKYLFLFKFKANEVTTNNLVLNKINCDKLKAQGVLDNLFDSIVNQGVNFFSHKHCCTIQRRFAEFLSFKSSNIVQEHFTLIMSNKDQLNVILDHFEGTQIYLTLISRKFQQFFYNHIKYNLVSQFHQLCYDTELHAMNFNTPNEFQVNALLHWVYTNIDKQGMVRNITTLVEYIVKQIDFNLIKDTFMAHILKNFDTVVGSQEGIRTEGLRVFGIVLSKLPSKSAEFEASMQAKILGLGCAKDMSIMIQKLIEMEETVTYKGPYTSNVDQYKQAVYIKTVVLKIVTQDYENSLMDPVQVFMGDSIGNYVLQTIYKCAEQFEKVYGQQLQRHKILSKIEFQYLNQYKQKKNKYAKSIYKNYPKTKTVL